MTSSSSGNTISIPDAPRLLVSVRNPAEARDALAGGCDLLDIKEPSRGPLGSAAPAVLAEIARVADASPAPLSAALGELGDWSHQPAFPLPERITLAKLGMAGAARQNDWRLLWKQVRQKFAAARPAPLGWIAVIYADWRNVDAPAPDDVLEAAIQEGCAGVLIDTACKLSGRLLDCLTLAEVRRLTERAEQQGLLTAVAGRLRLTDLEPLCGTARIIAVRSAVCRDEQRDAAIDANAVRLWSLRLREITSAARRNAVEFRRNQNLRRTQG